MKLTLEKIGAIQNASIELVGLTVIAGENDTGKSTLGKVSFALVQAFSTFPIAVKKNHSNRLRRSLDMLYFEIRRHYDVAQYPEIRDFFSKLRIHSIDPQNIPFTEIERLIKTLVEADGPINLGRPRSGAAESIYRRLHSIRAGFEEAMTDEKAIGLLVHRALSSEFAGQIQYASQEDAARISLMDGMTTVLDMEISNAKVLNFSGGEPLGFRDATLVDGPSILQYFSAIRDYDVLDFGESSRYRGSIPYHTVDLLKKIKGSPGKSSLESHENICDVYSGRVVFDNDNDNFYLKRGAVKIPSVNIASGIKALSILDLLIKGDYVRDDTLLILDEPETNLHPTWQIAYAKSICKLVEGGARILVTTHSPYMLEALKGYCSEKIESKYYLAERYADGRVSYTDTLGDISPIVETLSKPLSDFLSQMDGDDF